MAPSSPDRDCENSRPASMRQMAIPSQIDFAVQGGFQLEGLARPVPRLHPRHRVPERQAAAP